MKPLSFLLLSISVGAWLVRIALEPDPKKQKRMIDSWFLVWFTSIFILIIV